MAANFEDLPVELFVAYLLAENFRPTVPDL